MFQQKFLIQHQQQHQQQQLQRQQEEAAAGAAAARMRGDRAGETAGPIIVKESKSPSPIASII